MNDYRDEIKHLLDVTGSSEQELKLAAEAIKLILRVAAKGDLSSEKKYKKVTEVKKEDDDTGQQKPKDISKPLKVDDEKLDHPSEASKEKIKIDRTLQTLQSLLNDKDDDQALENWIKRDPKIFSRLTEMAMVYRVSTRRIGFKAFNNHSKELKFNETIRSQFEPRNGDAIVVHKSNTDVPWIVKLIRCPDEYYYPNTVTFDRGVVEKDDNGNLIVKRDVSGKKLRVDGELFTYKVTSDFPNVKEGSVVRLRWYAQVKNERQNDDISLAWVYPPKQKLEKVVVTPKKEKRLKQSYQPTIDFDLEGKTVGIVVGRELYRDKYEAIVSAHNGKLLMVDAFYHRRDPESYFSRRLREASYVVMVQNQNKHNTSYALAKIRSQFLGFAVSKNMTGLQVEQAIYRAVKQLPAFV